MGNMVEEVIVNNKHFPKCWNYNNTAGMFIVFANQWYEKYLTFPDWFPVEAPNFDNYIMPKHKKHDETFEYIDIYSQYQDVILWIYENCVGNWDYNSIMINTYFSNHRFYFDNKNDLILAKIVWG